MSSLPLFAAYLVAYALLHSALATDRVKAPLRTCCPRFARFYRAIYSLISVVTLYPLILFLEGSPDLYRVEGEVAVLLRILQVVGAIGFVYSARAVDLGDFLGYRPASSQENGTLTIDGPYRICRHPLYFFASLFLVAQPAVTEAYAVFTVWTVSYFWLGSWIEERRMVDRFGSTYLDYRSRTPHFLPLPRKQKTGPR